MIYERCQGLFCGLIQLPPELDSNPVTLRKYMGFSFILSCVLSLMTYVIILFIIGFYRASLCLVNSCKDLPRFVGGFSFYIHHTVSDLESLSRSRDWQ